MRSLVRLLEQTQIWRGQDGRVYYVGELSDEHLGNIIAYLGRHAGELLDRRRELDHEVDTQRAIEHVLGLEQLDPLDWLLDRPLYRRLMAEQRRRGSIDGWVVEDRLERYKRAHSAELTELSDDVDVDALRQQVAELTRLTDPNDEEAVEQLGKLLDLYYDALRRLGEL